jgi:hypothetical protein
MAARSYVGHRPVTQMEIAAAVGVMTGRRRSGRYSPHPVTRAVALMLIALVPLSAYADPGSGLLFYQLASAFVLGLIYHVRKFFADRKKK